MDFWDWLVHTGLISGDASAYRTGKYGDGNIVSSADYQHALRTAMANLSGASDPTARYEFFRRLQQAGGLVATDSLDYWADPARTPTEFEQVVSAATPRLVGALPSGSGSVPSPVPTPTPTPEPRPNPTTPTPTPTPTPTSTPVDFRARAAALYPFLPPSLLDIFADKWAASGDPNLALAETRADSRYDSYFPGIKRSDGSLRMSEAEYLGRIDGYHMALSQFGLNSTVFSNHFIEMIEGDLDPSELASRLSSAYDQVITAMPGVREFYATNYGVDLTDEAIFASFIDPELGNAILNQRIAVSQIGGAGAAFGFQIDLAFAERIRQRGLGASQANQAFAEAAYQIPILDTLAQRFDTDPTFDLSEFAGASIFADPAQLRRIKRIRGAEASTFSENLGGVRTGEDFAVTGLSPR